MNSNFTQLNKETYDKIAKLFAQTRKYLWDDLKPLKKYTKDNDKVLDLGCGTGRLYHLFSDFQPYDSAQGKGVEYVGMDQSSAQLAVAREEFPENTYVEAEMTSLPFEDNEFDIIYCIATFHHLSDESSRIKALEEMKRILKPSGHIIMTNWNLNSMTAQKMVEKGKFKRNDQDVLVPWLNPEGEVLGERFYYAFDSEELKNLFKKTDLTLEDQYYTKKGARGGEDDPGNIVSILHSSE